MTKIIGLTGGIGSGKTTVAQEFLAHGIPIYIADAEAKKIMDSPEIVNRIKDLFGEDVINKSKVNRKKIAQIVFQNPHKLQQLNAIIHPAVGTHFKEWVKSNEQHPFVIKETAILFESGTNKYCDKIITVTAPLEIKLERVAKRDHLSREEILSRMKSQWSDEEKMAKSDYVIINIDFKDTKEQIVKILKELNKI
jgi:dephospho-CoA kinase